MLYSLVSLNVLPFRFKRHLATCLNTYNCHALWLKTHFIYCITILSGICVCNFDMCPLPHFIHFAPIFTLFPIYICITSSYSVPILSNPYVIYTLYICYTLKLWRNKRIYLAVAPCNDLRRPRKLFINIPFSLNDNVDKILSFYVHSPRLCNIIGY